LDGYLSNPHGPLAAMSHQPVKRCIHGLLKGSSDRVLLCDVNRNGGRFSTAGISFERFSASIVVNAKRSSDTGVRRKKSLRNAFIMPPKYAALLKNAHC
jgi:hypothetical protein